MHFSIPLLALFPQWYNPPSLQGGEWGGEDTQAIRGEWSVESLGEGAHLWSAGPSQGAPDAPGVPHQTKGQEVGEGRWSGTLYLLCIQVLCRQQKGVFEWWKVVNLSFFIGESWCVQIFIGATINFGWLLWLPRYIILFIISYHSLWLPGLAIVLSSYFTSTYMYPHTSL